jgi:hypothetical protein
VDIIGLAVSGAKYIADLFVRGRGDKKRDRQRRIQNVVNQYMTIRRQGMTAELDGLMKAGIATLHDDTEIDEAVRLIMLHGENDPLQRGTIPEMAGVPLKAFFEAAAARRTNFFHRDEIIGAIEEAARTAPERSRR